MRQNVMQQRVKGKKATCICVSHAIDGCCGQPPLLKSTPLQHAPGVMGAEGAAFDTPLECLDDTAEVDVAGPDGSVKVELAPPPSWRLQSNTTYLIKARHSASQRSRHELLTQPHNHLLLVGCTTTFIYPGPQTACYPTASPSSAADLPVVYQAQPLGNPQPRDYWAEGGWGVTGWFDWRPHADESW